MKYKELKFHKKFSVNTTFLDESMDLLVELEDGDVWQECALKIRKEMIDHIKSYTPNGILVNDSVQIVVTPVTEKEIQIDKEPVGVVKEGILNCKNMTELATYHLRAKNDPELYSLYMNKAKEFVGAIKNSIA